MKKGAQIDIETGGIPHLLLHMRLVLLHLLLNSLQAVAAEIKVELSQIGLLRGAAVAALQ